MPTYRIFRAPLYRLAAPVMVDVLRAATPESAVARFLERHPETPRNIRISAVAVAPSLFSRVTHVARASWAVLRRQFSDDQPSEQAIETMFELVSAKGVGELRQIATRLEPSVAREFREALKPLARRLYLEGFDELALGVLNLWKELACPRASTI